MQESALKTMKGVAILLIAVAAVIYSFQYKRSVDNTYPGKTFSVDGTGDIDVTPNIAKFSASVITEGGKNVAEVQKTNTEKMNKVNAFLKEQGIEAKDLKTTQYTMNPRYSYPNCLSSGTCPAPEITGYSVNQSLEVKVRDTEKLGDLLSGVVANGANSTSEVNFVVDDEDVSKDAARAEAISKAAKKANTMAKAGGFRIGKLVSIYENSNMNPVADSYGMGGGLEMSSAKVTPAPTIEPGTSTTKVQVTLTYEILN